MLKKFSEKFTKKNVEQIIQNESIQFFDNK